MEKETKNNQTRKANFLFAKELFFVTAITKTHVFISSRESFALVLIGYVQNI